ncbi:serine palmitoyltransferase [Angomonas deanei]|nr:serine palmitoyltransferase [Angomonas deanei]|eukprot:EPY34465.1 serine palmitoyltransferase [Angomonas deanei]
MSTTYEPNVEVADKESLDQIKSSIRAAEETISENKINQLSEEQTGTQTPQSEEVENHPTARSPSLPSGPRPLPTLPSSSSSAWHTYREFYRKFFPRADSFHKEGYAPIVKDFDSYWNRRFYRRIRDCFARPIDSRPSRVIGIVERFAKDMNADYEYTDRIIPAINLGSYNYLGFAEDTPSITYDVLDSLDVLGVASCSSPQEVGQNACVAKLEKEFAHFIGKEDAIICGMGFGTNFRGIPGLVGKGCLAISDSLNHSSLVNGVRSSGAKVQVFKHGRYDLLEKLLRDAVVLGQNPAGDYKPYTRIVIIVEGIYSMEGEIINLKKVVELKKKYKALLFVDEAHSIGALGKSGRGVCEHCGVNPKDVDVLMGTFTKSFGSIGGYIASTSIVVDHLRRHSCIALHCDTLAPPCAQQVLSVLDVMLGKDGTTLGQDRIKQLKDNSRFFRQGLIRLGFTVLGDDASPVVPVMCYNLGKLPALARLCLERGVAIVVVGYPATPLLESRVRFCVSAAHTREDLEYTLSVMEELSKEVYLDYNHSKYVLPIKG